MCTDWGKWMLQKESLNSITNLDWFLFSDSRFFHYLFITFLLFLLPVTENHCKYWHLPYTNVKNLQRERMIFWNRISYNRRQARNRIRRNNCEISHEFHRFRCLACISQNTAHQINLWQLFPRHLNNNVFVSNPAICTWSNQNIWRLLVKSVKRKQRSWSLKWQMVCFPV